MTETISYIPSRVKNCAEGGHVAGAIDIIDDGSGITLDELVGNKKYASADFSGMGRVVFKKNIVNGVNTLTKEMMSDANTIYVIQYDFTLGENISVPANCVLEFDGGTLSYGSYILSGNVHNLVIYQNWFKTVDDFFKFINNVDGPVRYEFTPGEYTATTKVDKNVDHAIIIEGNGAKINWTPAVANSLGTVFDIRPRGYNDDALYPSVSITAAINSGDQTFTVADASGFAVGDVLALKDNQTSSFFWSRNYQEGEFVKIQKIDGNIITADKPITGDYINVGYLTATKAPLKKCVINNLHLNQTEGQSIVTRGLYVFMMNGELNNVAVTNFQYCIVPWNCWNFSINNCFASNAEINYTVGSVDGYALCVNNCQNLKVIGGRFTGKNHGVATGGYYDGKYAIINRFIIYENIETANTVTGGNTDSIDAHDDSDYITVKNCVASGIALGGKHHTVVNCKCLTIAIRAGNSFEHSIIDNIVKYEIGVRMYDHSGSYEYAYGNTKSIDHNESLLVYGNICGTIIIENRCTELRYDMTKLNVYVKNNVMRNGRSHCYFSLVSISNSSDLDNAASIVLVDNILDLSTFEFNISCNSALLLDNKIDVKSFNLHANTCTIENCFITVNTNLKPYLYKSIRIVRSRFIAGYLNMVIQKNTVTDIVVEDCIFETTNSYYAIRCTSEMNDTNTNIRCVGNFAKGNVANILRIDKASSVTEEGTKTLVFYNNKKNNGEDAGIDNQIGVNLVQIIPAGTMRIGTNGRPEWFVTTDNINKFLDNRGFTTYYYYKGATGSRPLGKIPSNGNWRNVLDASVDVGWQYFDTTLGKVIFAKAINNETGEVTWVDALGNSVDTVYPKVIGTPTNGNLTKFNSTNIEDAGVAPNV